MLWVVPHRPLACSCSPNASRLRSFRGRHANSDLSVRDGNEQRPLYANV